MLRDDLFVIVMIASCSRTVVVCCECVVCVLCVCCVCVVCAHVHGCVYTVCTPGGGGQRSVKHPDFFKGGSSWADK